MIMEEILFHYAFPFSYFEYSLYSTTLESPCYP